MRWREDCEGCPGLGLQVFRFGLTHGRRKEAKDANRTLRADMPTNTDTAAIAILILGRIPLLLRDHTHSWVASLTPEASIHLNLQQRAQPSVGIRV